MTPRASKPAGRGAPFVVIVIALTLWCTASAAIAAEARCGNRQIEAGESCDDGNTRDDDACPGDCVIDSCTSLGESRRSFTVSYEPPPGNVIGALSVLVDYPEGRISPVKPVQPGAALTDLPDQAVPVVTDLGHALRVMLAKPGMEGIDPGELFRVHFQDCAGTSAPDAGDLTCTVLESTDPMSNPMAGAACSVGP